MTLSDLIVALQSEFKKHGNVEVEIHFHEDEKCVGDKLLYHGEVVSVGECSSETIIHDEPSDPDNTVIYGDDRVFVSIDTQLPNL